VLVATSTTVDIVVQLDPKTGVEPKKVVNEYVVALQTVLLGFGSDEVDKYVFQASVAVPK
jgi:hypothetical protein